MIYLLFLNFPESVSEQTKSEVVSSLRQPWSCIAKTGQKIQITWAPTSIALAFKAWSPFDKNVVRQFVMAQIACIIQRLSSKLTAEEATNMSGVKHMLQSVIDSGSLGGGNLPTIPE